MTKMSTASLLFFPSLIVILMVAFSHYQTRSDYKTLCKMNIRDTQRYLSVKNYDIIYLYSEACNSYPPGYPHRLETLDVEMTGHKMWASTNNVRLWFGVPHEERRIDCNITRYSNDNDELDGEMESLSTIRMLFTEIPGRFDGVVTHSSLRHGAYDIKCPTKLKVIRFSKKK